MSKFREARPKWRPALAALCLAGTFLTPAYAWGRDREEGLGDLSRDLSDPDAQAKAAATLSALTGALLDTDISSFTRTLDRIDGGRSSRDLPPDARLGDLLGEDLRDLPDDIARNTPRAMGTLAGITGAIEEMGPQIRQVGRDFKHRMRERMRDQGLPRD